MNHVSLRASPGGSTAFSRNWLSLCVFVKQPSFSACPAAGNRNTSVSMSSRPKLALFHLRRVQPERSRLDFHHIPHHQPLEVRQRLALQPRIRRAHPGILPHHKKAFDVSFGHLHPVADMRMVAGYPRQPVEAVIVFLSCVFAVICL